MLQKVYDDPYITIYVDPEKGIYIEDWKSMHKDGEKWKELHLIGFDIIKKYKPKIYISFTDKSIFTPTEELNKWFVQQVKEQGIDKIIKAGAVIIPQDFVVSLGMEMLIQEIMNNLNIPVLFFRNREEALQWADKQAQELNQ